MHKSTTGADLNDNKHERGRVLNVGLQQGAHNFGLSKSELTAATTYSHHNWLKRGLHPPTNGRGRASSRRGTQRVG
jgi:hypothetical protein